MANPDHGFCTCPVCEHPRASVRIAANNKAYTSCDECLSSVRTLSGKGDREIRSWITEFVSNNSPQPVSAAAPGETSEPPAAARKTDVSPAPGAKKKTGMFADALDSLAGRK